MKISRYNVPPYPHQHPFLQSSNKQQYEEKVKQVKLRVIHSLGHMCKWEEVIQLGSSKSVGVLKKLLDFMNSMYIIIIIINLFTHITRNWTI